MINPADIAVYALTRGGAETAQRLVRDLPGSRLFLPERLEPNGFKRLSQALAENWTSYAGHITVCAAGITVRAMAPLIKHKTVDPAVIVADETGRFVISLLSGHLGGANDLTRQAAEILGGQAVITTATDSTGKPSLDVLAKKLGFRMERLPALSRIGCMLLEDAPVRVYDPDRRLAPSLADWPDLFIYLEDQPDPSGPNPVTEPLIWVGPEALDFPKEWLIIRPPCLYLGLGCNRGTDAAEMLGLINTSLEKFNLSRASIAGMASVDLKNDEPGLLALAEQMNLPLTFFNRQELASVEVPNPSAAAEKHIGVKSVCEAAALLAAQTGRLAIPKQKTKNVTLAAACSR